MNKRYTVVFDPKLGKLDVALKAIEHLGVRIESEQRFIGTAIVLANDEQAQTLRGLKTVVSVALTGQVRAGRAS